MWSNIKHDVIENVDKKNITALVGMSASFRDYTQTSLNLGRFWQKCKLHLNVFFPNGFVMLKLHFCTYINMVYKTYFSGVI